MNYTLKSSDFNLMITWINNNGHKDRIFPGLGPYIITDCSQIPIITGQLDTIRANAIRGFSMFQSNYLTESNFIPASCGIAGTLATYFGSDVDPYYPPLINPPPTPTQTPPSPTASVGKPGDANGDGKVDGLDYVIWLNHYGQNLSGATVGDFNSDGKVDGLDYVVWLNNYGK